MKTLLPLLERMDYLYQKINEYPQNHQLIHYYLSTFIAEVSIISEKNSLKSIVHPLVSKFQQLINEKFKESKNVQFYASLLHVSPNHLNKIVKKETGKTASTIINQVCILEAKVLLTQTDLDIMEIAHQLGFDDSSYFSRFFKRHTSTSPANYRKMIDLS